MNFLTLSLGPTRVVFHPIDRSLAARSDITRDALVQLSARFNETYLVLYRLSGHRDSIEATLDRHDGVLDYRILPCGTNHITTRPDNTGDSVYAFIHLDMSTSAGWLIELAHKHALIIDTPITFDGDSMHVTLIGIDTSLRGVLQSRSDAIDVSVHDAGAYDPRTDELLSPLTDRQLEVFEAAVEHGYYAVPRRATHRDIAAALDCAPSTIDEHLRKAESAVIPHLFSS